MNESLTDAHQQFVEYLENSGKAHATVIAYSKDIEQLTEFLNQDKSKQLIAEVTNEDIEDFKNILKTRRYAENRIS